MSAPSPNPAGALGLGDHPRPATSASNTRRNIAGPYPMATYNTTQSQDNHAPHGAHANWFGTVNHIAGGESALFQNHQLGQPQLATHQFNFSPGSYATFPTQQYQNIGRLETHQPSHKTPAEAEAEQREFRQAWTDFINPDDDDHSESKKFDGQPMVDGNDPQNAYSRPVFPQQLSQPMHNTAQPQYLSHQGVPSTLTMLGSLDPPPSHSLTQQQSSTSINNPSIPQPHEQHPVPHNTAHVPKSLDQHYGSRLAVDWQATQQAFENSKGGQTVSNTQGYQASSVQTQNPVSLAQKRRISTLDGGSMAGNGEGSGEAKHTAKRTKTKESDEEVYLGPTNFGQGVLHDLSIEEAEECFIKREPLLCDKKDDVDDVVANKEGWIRALMSSFDKPYSPTPVSGRVIEGFAIHQEKYYQKMMDEIDGDETGMIVEAVATLVYNRVVESHQTKSLVKGGGSLACSKKMICSDRLTRCITAIEKLAKIRYDVIKNSHIIELVANPGGLMKRKED